MLLMSCRAVVSCRRPSSVVLAALVLLLSACSRPAPAPEPLRSVKLVTLGAHPPGVQADYAAEVRARVESRLGFRVGGKLVQRPAEVGQSVKAGQLLAALDAQDLQLAAQAALAQQAAAQTQHDLALADFRRFESLRAQNFISEAELQRREASLQAARASLEQAQAQAQAQKNQAGYAQLHATASGVVTAVEAEVGQVVSAGQPVLRLAHDGPRDAVFAVAEQTAMGLHIGQPMQATLTSTGAALKGRVREIGASADPVTRTYAVKLALEASERLPLGATVHVRAEGPGESAASVLRLPTSALRQEGSQTTVWVLDEASMTVRAVPVQLGPVQGNEVVIRSGLQTGQRVVAAGVHVLSPGQKVTVYGESTPAGK